MNKVYQFQNRTELDFVQSRKRSAMNTDPDLYTLPVSHPVEIDGDQKVYHELGAFTCDSVVKLRICRTEAEASRAAEKIASVIQPVSTLGEEAGLTLRMADTMLSLGRPCTSAEIADSLMSAYYPGRETDKFRGMVRAKIWHGVRFFKEIGEGQYELRPEGVDLVGAARAGRTVKQGGSIWTGVELLDELSPKDNGVTCQMFSLNEDTADKVKEQWLRTPEEAERLRLGLLSEIRKQGIPVEALGPIFGTEVSLFAIGEQRKISREKVAEIALQLRVPENRILLRDAPKDDLRSMAEKIAVPLSESQVDRSRVDALTPINTAKGRRQNRRIGRSEVVMPSDECEFDSPNDVAEAIHRKFVTMDPKAGTYFCRVDPGPDRGVTILHETWEVGVFDCAGVATLRRVPSRRAALNTAQALSASLEAPDALLAAAEQRRKKPEPLPVAPCLTTAASGASQSYLF